MKDKVSQFLQDWVLNFIKNRDIITRTIEDIKTEDEKITVQHTNKIQEFNILPFIKKLPKITVTDEFICLVTYNTKENFDSIINNWNELIKNPKLSVYFVNPMSKLEKKWIIFPHTHNSISDKASLKPGLLSLFNTVDVLTEEEIKKIFS